MAPKINTNNDAIQGFDDLTKGLHDLVDVAKEATATIKELGGSKIKITSNASKTAGEIQQLTDEIENLLKPLKAPAGKEKLFTSLENSAINLKKVWERLNQEVKNNGIEQSDLFSDKKIKPFLTQVLRSANAYEALGGNISDISSEISELVGKMRQMDSYSGSSYAFKVDDYKEAFKVFQKMHELGVSFNNVDWEKNFKPLEDKIQTLSSLRDYFESHSKNTQNSSDEQSADSPSKSDDSTESYKREADAAEKVKEKVEELSEAEMKLKLQRSRVKKEASIYDINIDWDEKIDDIQRYSQALEKLKENAEYHLKEATYWQNRMAESLNDGNSKDAENQEKWMNRDIQRYYEYLDQVDLVQNKLHEAILDYSPSDGKASEEMKSLLVILKGIYEHLSKIGSAFSNIDENSGFGAIVKQIDKLNVSLSETMVQVVELANTINSKDFSVNISLGGSVDKQRQIGKLSRKVIKDLDHDVYSLLDFANSHGINNGKMLKGIEMDFFELDGISDSKKSLTEKIEFYTKLVDTLKSNAVEHGLDISGWTNSFENEVKNLLISIEKLESGEQDLERSTEKLKNLFGNNNTMNFGDVITEFDGVASQLQEISDILSKSLTVKDVINNNSFDFKEEATGLDVINQSVEHIIASIAAKNDLFAQESKIVSDTVNKELPLLSELEGVLSTIVVCLDKISNFSGAELNIKTNISDLPGKETPVPDDDEIASTYAGDPPDPSLIQNSLQEIQKILNGNPLEFVAKFNEASTLRELEKIAPDIAAEWNKQYGTNLKASDVVKTYNSIQKSIEAANKEREKQLEFEKQAIVNAELLRIDEQEAIYEEEIRFAKEKRKEEDAIYEANRKEYEADYERLMTEQDEIDELNLKLNLRSQILQADEAALEREEAIKKNNAEIAEIERERAKYANAYSKLLAERDEAEKQKIADQKKLNSVYDRYEKALAQKHSAEKAETEGKSNAETEFMREKALKEIARCKAKILEYNEKNIILEERANQISEQEVVYALRLKEIQNERTKNKKEKYDNKLSSSIQNWEENLDKFYTLQEKKRRGIITESELKLLEKYKNEISRITKEINELNKSGFYSRKFDDEINRINKKKDNYESNFKAIDSDENEKRGIKDLSEKYEELNKLIEKRFDLEKKIANGDKSETTAAEYKNIEDNISDIKWIISEYQRLGIENQGESIKLLEREKQLEKDILTLKSKKAYAEEFEAQKKLHKLRKEEAGLDKEANPNRSKDLERQIALAKEELSKAHEKVEIYRDLETHQNHQDEYRKRQLEAEAIINDKLRKRENIIDRLGDKIGDYADKTAAQAGFEKYLTSEFGGFEDLQMRELKNGFSEFVAKVKTANGESKELVATFTGTSLYKNIKRAKNETSSWAKIVDFLGNRWKNVLGYLASFGSFYEIWNWIQRALDVVIEMDNAFTEMRKVTDETVTTLKEYQRLTFDIADNVGSTAQALQESTASWMRLGESLEQASQSAQDTTILLNVSEFDNVDDATTSLVAMSQAYKEFEKIEIIDKLNNIGNNYSIATNDLASSLQRSAATLKIAGNTLDEAIALTTAGNTILQDPDSVGAGLKTISLRILGTEAAKEELEALGEDISDFVVQTQSTIDKKVRDFTATASNPRGISVLDENGNYRSTYQILQDIADVYQEILKTDKQFGTNRGQALVELLAGKNRANILSSILQAPDILRNVYEDSMTSKGSAQKELDAYLDSVSGKIQQLKNRLQELATIILDTDFVKDTVDLGTDGLEVLTNLIEQLGIIKPLIIAVTGALSLNNVGRPKMFGLFEYADPNMCSLEYQSFHVGVHEIHECKRSLNIRGIRYNVA